jgi:hypothetical protein
MNLKRIFLILVATLFLVYCAFSVGTILIPRGNETLYLGESNPKIPGTSSEVFGKRYSTSHPPCYGQLEGDRQKGFSTYGRTP